MTIKFIFDPNDLSKDREQIEEILESLKQRPIELNTRSNFLRKFTLASIDVFKKKYHPELGSLRINYERNLELKVPEKLELDIEIPKKVDVPVELFLQAPSKFEIPKELLENAPTKELDDAPERRKDYIKRLLPPPRP